MVPHWCAGERRAGSYRQSPEDGTVGIECPGLGNSGGHQYKGITAEVVEVKAWARRTAREFLRNKIVFFNG